MSKLGEQLAEDRALRDAALQLFKSDIALVRGDLHERGIGARAKDRLGDAAMGMLDDAIDYAESNKGWVAAGAAAVVLWFARKPILGAVADLLDDGAEAEPGEVDRRSPNEADYTGDIR
jgi:hypothetical protein